MGRLCLINTNRMRPPIAPVGLEYVAAAAQQQGHAVDIVDLCLAEDPQELLRSFFEGAQPDLVGLSLRNVDDCFWPSAQSFVPQLIEDVKQLRELSDAPLVLGGVGASIFTRSLFDCTGVDFAVRGDGEQAVAMLMEAFDGSGSLDKVPGLLWRDGGEVRINAPAWPDRLNLSPRRDLLDNTTYFRLGGQVGIETKRGCPRQCTYCADPLAKGTFARLRRPGEIIDEFESLAAQGIDVIHLCDSEFNIPRRHAVDVCKAMIERGVGRRVRWYAYLSTVPFDDELAGLMRRAGCVGINFTGDSASPQMLEVYGQPWEPDALDAAVRHCRRHDMAVMIDLLLGGPGETWQTLAESINFLKQIDPDCIGASMGVRIYPGTAMQRIVDAQGEWCGNPSIRRRYDGPIDLLQPTFYIEGALGDDPACGVQQRIGDDPRFFAPMAEADLVGGSSGEAAGSDHNYNDNRLLTDAIANGARGAYWDILRQNR